MKLSEHFSLSEFTKSQTAERRGIINHPEIDHIANMKELCENILEPVREEFGVTVINSGYRSKQLNEAIGGSSTSQHCKGEAADIEVPGVSNLEIAQWIVDNDLPFDQLILEFYTEGEPSSGWVHVSYGVRKRGQVLTAAKRSGRTVYLEGINP